MKSYTTIDEYIGQFDEKTQNILRKIRAIIHKTVPLAEETISYGIPTFTLHGNLVHFGAYPKHIGFYPGSEAIEHFLPRLSEYSVSKGTIQFQLDEKIPFDLIKEITVYRRKKQTGKK